MISRAMNVVTIAIGACAKFTTRVARQISTSASANAAYTIPRVMPPSKVLTNCCTVIPSEPQVGVAELFVSGQDVGGLVDDDPAEVEHDGSMGDREGAAGVLLDQHDGQAVVGDQTAQQVEDLGHHPRRQPERGLVEQQQRR